MARFRGTVQGNRGETSRLGSKALTVTCNAWDVGVRCSAEVLGDRDVIWVYVTRGSHDPEIRQCVGYVDNETGTFRPSEDLKTQ